MVQLDCLPEKERTIPVNSQMITFHEMNIRCFPAHSMLLSINCPMHIEYQPNHGMSIKIFLLEFNLTAYNS